MSAFFVDSREHPFLLNVLEREKRGQMRKLILPLKENHLFSKTYARGKSEVSKLCAVYIMRNFKRNPDGSPMKTKLGITVNRKLGKACKRNRVKRLIREAYRENYEYIKDGYIMIIAARAAAFAPHIKAQDMSRAFKKIVSKDDFFNIPKKPQKKN